MVEIISKSDGPRREDAAARHYLRENASTIHKIAQQLSGGRLRSAPDPGPAPAGAANKARSAPRRASDSQPYTKISLNGRVVAIDLNSGRQLHHLGEFRGVGSSRRFYLAVARNGFYALLDEPIAEALLDLDQQPTLDAAEEEALARAIDARLGYTSVEAG